MQQQGGQLMDDIGERGEGECYSFYLVRASPGTDIREVKSVTEQDDKYTDIPLPLNATASPSFLPSITALSSSCLSTLLLHVRLIDTRQHSS